MEVSDVIAEKLEAKGFWRRAAARWLDVMQICKTETQRDWISQIRLYCLTMSLSPHHSGKPDIKAVNRAATIVQKQMGIYREKGIEHKNYSERKIRKTKRGDVTEYCETPATLNGAD